MRRAEQEQGQDPASRQQEDSLQEANLRERQQRLSRARREAARGTLRRAVVVKLFCNTGG